ncbi:hypothetical protein [Frigoriglobus tundricola]|uniref:Uncharacterized protein n=1 Tax=Frigoriglobus tundricola TaxID=2774151 RepID=A0A6M5YPM0_9BACT|nr:hypothetical protein [Frigoriglobus tundricola]QJW95243.1 hypothetical protein FTUN_2785 [Frigoriglobus tundricola]
MRTLFAAAVLLGAAALVPAQPPKDPPKAPPKDAPKDPPPDRDADAVPKDLGPKYGVKTRLKQYPQTTPKESLRSVLAAVEGADYTYIVAQLLDPKFVAAAVADRAKQLEPGAEAELAQLRDFQRANRDRIAPEDRVPLDPVGLRALAAVKATERGFKRLVRDVEQKLLDDPQTVKEFRRILRDGSFAEADPAASATHPDMKGRTLYFNKIGDRWFLENRQTEEPKKEP